MGISGKGPELAPDKKSIRGIFKTVTNGVIKKERESTHKRYVGGKSGNQDPQRATAQEGGLENKLSGAH